MTIRIFFCAAALFAASLVSSETHAQRSPSIVEKEQILRTSLFAEDNPARYVGQEQFLQQQQQQMQRDSQQQQYQQRQLQYQQQQYDQQQQRNDQRAAYQQQQQQRQQQRQQPQQAPKDEEVVGFVEDGSVKVRSGNKMVDQSAGDYLNRKFRNVLNTLWR